jgi:hypothetical protein
MRLASCGRRRRRRRRSLVPLHTPPFGSWFLMMEPGLITSDNMIQEVITFTDSPLQKTTADVLAVMLMNFGQKFGPIPCGKFA